MLLGSGSPRLQEREGDEHGSQKPHPVPRDALQKALCGSSGNAEAVHERHHLMHHGDLDLWGITIGPQCHEECAEDREEEENEQERGATAATFHAVGSAQEGRLAPRKVEGTAQDNEGRLPSRTGQMPCLDGTTGAV